MTSRLVDIVEMVRAAFEDPNEALGPYDRPVNCDAVSPLDEAVRWYVGGRFVFAATGFPRIVVAMAGGDMRKPMGAGFVKAEPDGRADQTTRQRYPSVRWLCWGRDDEEAELMMHTLCVAMFEASKNAIVPDSESWAFDKDGSITGGGSLVEIATRIPFDVRVSDKLILMRPTTPNPTEPGYPTTKIARFETTVIQGDETISLTQEPDE